MDMVSALVTITIGLALYVTAAEVPRTGRSTQYLTEEKALRTVVSGWTPDEMDFTTQSLDNHTVTTDEHISEVDHHSDGVDCSLDKRKCKEKVKECGHRIFMMMMKDVDYEWNLEEGDPCRCVFHCFVHYGKACARLSMRINQEERQYNEEKHSVFEHLAEIMGAFAVGAVVGVLIALLLVIVMRRCAQSPVEQPREMRLLSGAGHNATLRAPMPTPIPAPEGFYVEGPIGVTSSPKLPRDSPINLYEALDELKANGDRPQSKESGQNMYFVLENETGEGRKVSASDEDADNMPSETNRTQRTTTSPDVVPEGRSDELPCNEDGQDSKL